MNTTSPNCTVIPAWTAMTIRCRIQSTLPAPLSLSGAGILDREIPGRDACADSYKPGSYLQTGQPENGRPKSWRGHLETERCVLDFLWWLARISPHVSNVVCENVLH